MFDLSDIEFIRWLLRDGKLFLGRAESIISAAYDPPDEPPGESYDPLNHLPDY